MATSAGFSIATSPPEAISGTSSPTKSGRPNTVRKTLTAAQLLEQIKQLETEGNKLRSEAAGPGSSTFSTLSDLNLSNNNDKVELPKFTSTSPSYLSALVDYSAEQKTISDLRLQLEKQRKETERLNTQLVGDGFSSNTSRVGTVFHLPSSPSKTGFSTLPSTELFSSRRPASVTGVSGAMEITPPSHLEKALKDSQEQVADIRRRLVEANEQSESQKRQFRLTVEELKAKLHDTMVNRDSLLELRQKEAVTLESKVSEQNATIRDLQHKLQAQEQTLAETSKKADGISRENFVSETTLNQVRIILVDAERRRGKPYFESDPASSQSPSMLVHTLERCIQELLKDIEIKKCKLNELEREVSDVKSSQSSDQQSISQEYQQKITQMTVDHERQMQLVNERANNARKQSATLESQLSVIQGQHEQQLKLREENVKDLENKIKHLREELHEERDKYSSKRESLEQTLNGTEKEMAKLRSERDEAIRNHSNMESKVADLQLTINRLNRDLETEKETSGKYWEREGQLRSKQSQLETRLEEKTRDVDRLEKMLASVKQECNATVSEKVSMIERQERERHMEKISSLTAQLSEVSEKCNKISLELDNKKAENQELKHQSREYSDKADTTKVQFEAAVAERKHLTDMLTAKSSDFDRVSQERDYYFSIMEQKNNELSQLKAERERLTIHLEEKEKNLTVLQEQANELKHMLESVSRTSESLREERDTLIQQLQETTAALEELKTTRDTMAKKMKIREKRVKELESEKQKNTQEIELRNQELSIIQQEKETLFKELKESRYEVVSLSEERDALKKDLEGQKYQLEKTISKLQYRLKAAEQDLGLAQKALRKRESVDNSAVKTADKLQKEVTAKRSLVDTMQSKIRWYQDQIDTLLKEKGNLENDKDKLKTSLNKALVQNQQLQVDVETGNSRTIELKNHVNKLESSLEKLIREQKKDYVALERVLKKVGKDKAALRNATTQAQVEMFEQEMTRMKLAHKLEVKEAVQKASSQHVDKADSKQRTSQPQLQDAELVQSLGYSQLRQGTSQPHSQDTGTVQPQGYCQMRPEFTAQHDRLQAQKSSENYKEIGSELKLLLSEMRNMITDRQDTKQGRPAPTRRQRDIRSKDSKHGTKSRPKPKTVEMFPVEKKAFTHYRVPPAPSDISYYSDAEVDDRIHNRSRSQTGTYALYSPEQKEDQARRSGSRHRRSRSAEASIMLSRDLSTWTESDYRTSDCSPPLPESDITDTNTSRAVTSDVESSSFSQELSDSDLITSLSVGSPVMESTKEDPSPCSKAIPDTQALCKRLEEKIISLTRMGDNLQKENKEMADLMKTQGRKLKKVKENEKKIRKTPR
ncbi:trichohyalin-like isoform X4 [Mercenaria mercenaria]|uniref:trichohyalin-like isoform X4 n=1 Tax=Mercenaria mercenaria TaxID=6596 RepID=UPI00234EA501|nr:trichohyalin-like isoform X4 [Mercenaria mercenaria]